MERREICLLVLILFVPETRRDVDGEIFERVWQLKYHVVGSQEFLDEVLLNDAIIIRGVLAGEKQEPVFFQMVSGGSQSPEHLARNSGGSPGLPVPMRDRDIQCGITQRRCHVRGTLEYANVPVQDSLVVLVPEQF